MKNVLKKIPDVDLKVSLHKFDSDEMKPNYKLRDVSLKTDDEIFLSVNAKRENHQFPLRVEMKNFGKVKDCSWWIVVGNEENNKVFAIKKTYFKKTLRRQFQVALPEPVDKLNVYLISDSYIGLDQVKVIDMDTYKAGRRV